MQKGAKIVYQSTFLTLSGGSLGIGYRIHKSLGAVVVTLRGDVDPLEHLDSIAAYAQDPDFEPSQSILFDLDGCRFPNHGYAEMRAVAMKSRRTFLAQSANVRHACFVTDDVTYGMCRMLQMLLDDAPWETEIFHSRAEALDFMQLDQGHPDYAAFADRWLGYRGPAWPARAQQAGARALQP